MAEYTLQELVRESGVKLRTLRSYVGRGLLPRPVMRGMYTTYGEEHLVRLRVIRRLRTRERMPIEGIRQRFEGITPAELRALDPMTPAPEPVAEPPAVVAVPAAAVVVPAAVVAAVAGPSGGTRWERIELLPGLELHVRAEGGPLLARLASEIQAQYAVPGSGPCSSG